MEIIFYINKALSIAFVLSVNSFIYYLLPFNFDQKQKKQFFVYLPIYIVSFIGFHYLIFQNRVESASFLFVLILNFFFVIFYYSSELYLFIGKTFSKKDYRPKLKESYYKFIKFIFIPTGFIVFTAFQVIIILGLLNKL